MNKSLWIKDIGVTNYPTLDKNIEVDTLIIGAGISGLSSAYYLSKKTKDVCIIEANHIGYGASGRNNGKISSQHGLIYHKLIKQYGMEKARLYYEANEEAIQSLSSIINKYKIDCDFKRVNSILYVNKEENIKKLQDEYQSCIDLKIPCEYVNENHSFPFYGGICFFKQAQFHPLKYLQGLAKIIEKEEIPIYENSVADQLYKVKDTYTVILKNECRITAKNIILSTQFPFIDQGHFYFSRVYAEQSFLLAASCSTKLDAQYINIEKNLHSYRKYKDSILIGGVKHKVGQLNDQEYQKFLKDSKETFHLDKDIVVWSSQDYMSFDNIPFIGTLNKEDSHLLLATGFSKWGNTSGTIAGKLLCSILLKEKSPYLELYNPHRFAHIFSMKFIEENMNIAYEFIKRKFKSEEDTFPNIGEGKILEIDNHKYGVYQNEDKKLFIVDITCPHLGCILSFDTVNKLWVCPCHGSLFNVEGSVVKGPANTKLNQYGEGLNKIDPHLFK